MSSSGQTKSAKPCHCYKTPLTDGRCAYAILQGATVSASDISSSMAGEAQRRYEATIAAGATPPKVRVRNARLNRWMAVG